MDCFHKKIPKFTNFFTDQIFFAKKKLEKTNKHECLKLVQNGQNSEFIFMKIFMWKAHFSWKLFSVNLDSIHAKTYVWSVLESGISVPCNCFIMLALYTYPLLNFFILFIFAHWQFIHFTTKIHFIRRYCS